MADTYTVDGGWKIILLDLGINPERVLRRAGQPLDLFSRGAQRIPVATYHALWDALAEETAGTSFPLRFAQGLRVEAFDPALFAIVCCPNLELAARRIAEYKPLVGPLKLQVEEHRSRITLRVEWPPTAQPPPVLGYSELLFWVSVARLCTREQIRPTELTVPVLPMEMVEYADYLGVRPVPGAAWSVSFSLVDARRPFLTANEGMWSFFQPELRRRLAEVEAAASMSERVRSALVELLPSGVGTAEVVAQRLGVSKRTLQRRLREEAASFQELLAQTRESLARHYLQESQLPAAEISFLLGYSDPNSFYRAFQAWTGTTPEALRGSALAEVG